MRTRVPPPALSTAGHLILSAQLDRDEGRAHGPVILYSGADRSAAGLLYRHGLLEDVEPGKPRVTPMGRSALRAHAARATGEAAAALREPERASA